MARILSRLAIGGLAAGAMFASQLTVDDPGTWDIGDASLAAARLDVAADCAEVTERVQGILREQAKIAREESAYGRAVPGAVAFDTGTSVTPLMAPAAPGAEGSRVASSTTAELDGAVVGTNVQEFGVDETDVLKTDGTTIYLLRANQLLAIDAATLTERDRIGFGQHWPHEMLLIGTRLVLFENIYVEVKADSSAARDAMPWFGGKQQTRLHVIDAANPDALVSDSVVTVDGSLVASRLVDGIVRVVVTTAPAYGYWGGPGIAIDVAFDRIAPPAPLDPKDVSAEDVLPTITVERAGTITTEPVPCDGVHIAPDAQTIESTTVFSLDPANPEPMGSVTALTGGGPIYANPRSIYLARPLWDQKDGERTELHRFDITDARATRYASAGTIDGTLLNQFSMSEHEGLLRVATTSGGTEEDDWTSSSAVRILREVGDELVETGVVDGLGVDERIYSVRFIGTLGYVVTFRQIDPLYVLDLSDPQAPRALGELKIPGYSAYLHPVGDGLLVGVGQDATNEGRTRGVLVSLFDVSDPADPQRIAKMEGLGDWSLVEGDHRAFQFLPEHQTIVVPATSWGGLRRGEESFAPEMGSAAHLIAVGPDGLTHRGSITHRDLLASGREAHFGGEISRSIAIGDTLFVLSDAGLTSTDLTSLEPVASLAF